MDWSWEILYPIGTLALGLVLAGTVFWARRRSKREKNITEAATHELYHHPERYARSTRKVFDEAAEREKRKREESDAA